MIILASTKVSIWMKEEKFHQNSYIFTESARELRCPSVCPCVCVSPPTEIYFQGLFAPTYKSCRPIVFGFLDFLGKSYGKDVVSDYTILARKWSKISAQKKVYFGLFF